jgi:hypothetical protein
VAAFAVGFSASGAAKAVAGPTLAVKGKAPATAPAGELESRMRAAWHSARLAIAKGIEMHGRKKKWETKGANRGPYVDEILNSVDAMDGEAGRAWCGIFHGYNYLRAGFDYKRPFAKRESYTSKGKNRKTLFWSDPRILHYWKATDCKRIQFPYKEARGKWSRAQCEAWLRDNFHPWGPLPGDIMLVDTYEEMSHVAMVGSYDPSTFELVSYEGNFGDRAAAWSWDLADPDSPPAGKGPRGLFRINWIGRFKESDFLAGLGEISPDGPSPDPEIENTRGAKSLDRGR